MTSLTPLVDSVSVLPGEPALSFRGPSVTTGAPLVLLHGLSGSSNSWAPVTERFGDTWRVWALDFRGHGSSEHVDGDYLFDDYVADASRLLDAIGEPAVVVGHSLGSLVAATLAQDDHPLVTAVLLEDPPLYLVEPEVMAASPFAVAFRQLADAVTSLQGAGAPVEVYRDAFGGTPHPAGGTQADHMWPDALWARAESLAQMDPGTIESILVGRTFADFRPDRPIRRPVSVLGADAACGGAFVVEHEARLLATTPHAEIIHVPGAAHNIRGDRVGRAPFLDALAEFLVSVG